MPDNWQIGVNGHKKSALSHSAKRLIDIRSPTAKAISRALSPLEHVTHMHITLDCGAGALEVNLLRLKLAFLLKEPVSLLESKKFRRMVVDECQSLGAFTGLVRKLVLREVEG